MFIAATARGASAPLAAHANGSAAEAAASSRATVVTLVTLTALVAVSILFESLTELLRESADELNMPFVSSVFSELTTLGFIGLLLFVVSQLDVLPHVSLAYLGEPEKLQETIEELHMGLFFIIIIFLVLCCALLRLGIRAQKEWREFECGATDLPSVVAEFVVATEPPRSWHHALSLSRWRRASRAWREIVYVSLRQRFLDFRSNHPNPVVARRLAKAFQLNPEIPFPFNEYLSIISGEVMARLIEIDWKTWVVLELCVVAVVALSWRLGEVWTLLGAGFVLVALNDFVHRRILCMRELLTPTRLLEDAAQLRRSNAWRATHELPPLAVDESSSLVEAPMREEEKDAFAPPYAVMRAQDDAHCSYVSEVTLARRQRALLGGGKGNGVRLAIVSTRLVFLLTAMHLATFLLRTIHQIHAMESLRWPTAIALDALFLLPSVLVTVLSVRIARDGLYAFSVEHLKVHRVISRVLRIQKARRTLRTLRFVAEMKIYLRETVHREELKACKPPSAESQRAIALAKTTRHSFRAAHATMPPKPSESMPPPLASYIAQPRHHLQQRREIYWLFCLFDVDGSGCVSRDEMARLLMAITHDLDDAQLGRLMDDLVGDDAACQEIAFDEFLAWCRANMQQCTLLHEELIHEIFRMVDVDASGYITVDEFITVFETLGQTLDHDDVRELVCRMDRNADGKIDLEEFTSMLHKHEV
jgi:Ca2+-binding EF-hand superfamily protein